MIRGRIYAWKLKKLAKKRLKEKTDLLSALKNTSSILILYVEKNTALMTFYNNLQEVFPEAKIHTWVYEELGEKQRERNHGVRKEAAGEITGTHFDMIIDATPFVSEAWFYFVSGLSANIVAGISKSDDYHIYNLLITFGSGKTADNGFSMVTDYLKKLIGKN